MTDRCVLLPVHPRWCRKIATGEKGVELRKTYPKLPTPFKCYIYCTVGGGQLTYAQYCGHDMETYEDDFVANGTVIGEFTCEKICHVLAHPSIFAGHPLFFEYAVKQSCLTENEIEAYGGGKDVIGWVITELKIYDKPKLLSDFGLTRAPQSWCYVKEVA